MHLVSACLRLRRRELAAHMHLRLARRMILVAGGRVDRHRLVWEAAPLRADRADRDDLFAL